MRISAKADYAVRATAELAAAEGHGPVKAEHISQSQGIPPKFLLNILNELTRAGPLARAVFLGAGYYASPLRSSTSTAFCAWRRFSA